MKKQTKKPLVANIRKVLISPQFAINRRLRKRIEELEVLNRISYTMNSSLNVRETLETVLDAAIELTNADRALMYLRDENDPELFIPSLGRGIDDIPLNFTVHASESIFSHVVRNREAVTVTDVLKDERVNQEYAQKVQTNSFVIAPMVHGEEVIGIVGVDNLHSGRSVRSIDIDLLMTLANQAAIALTNSRHHEKVEQMNKELQQRIDAATEDLQRMVETQSHFLTVASHQLRTPSTVVRGVLSMMVEDPHMPVEEHQKYAQQAFHSMTRLQRIISELLSATELEGTILRPFIEEVSVRSIVEEVTTELQPLADEQGVTLLIEQSAQLDSAILTDQYRLQEALANIVDNAIRYTPEGTVTVRVTDKDDQIHFIVRDTGVGITLEDLQVIFEKFQRGASIMDIAPNGSGLGLFIAKRITELLDGSISASSEGEGKGAEFCIAVPKKGPAQAVDSRA